MRDKDSERLAKNVIAELEKARKEKRVSHEKLAEMTGLSRAAISFIESGKRNPTLVTCLKIAKALDLDLGDIITHRRK
jgi:DNA-binding XRE family transcriptional regulator